MRDGVRAAGAAGAGMAAVAAHALLPDVRAAVAVAVVVVGLVLWRAGPTGVERSAGRAGVLVGAALLGQVLVVAGDPGVASAVLLAPLAVAALVLRGTAGWVVLGVVLPAIAASLAGAHVVAVLSGMAVVALVVALARAGSFWVVLGATAAAGSAGAGVAPVAALVGTSVAAPQAHLGAVVVAVVVPVVLALVAVLRRDPAGGLVAGGALAVPPVGLVVDGSAVPLLLLSAVALLAGSAIVLRPFGELAARVAGRVRGSGGLSRAALVAVVGGTAVAAAVHGVPALGVSTTVRGPVTLVLLLTAAGIAWWLPRGHGGPLAGLALAGLAVGGPWQRLGLIDGDTAGTALALAVFSAIGLVVSSVLITALWLRHRHRGVTAGAALLLLHDVAWLLTTATGDLVAAPLPVFGPLVLLGAAALRADRTALAVVVGAAGCTLATLTVRTFTAAQPHLDALRVAPLTPTDALLTAELPANPAWIVALLLVALLGARTAGAPLVVLFGTQALLVSL